MWKPLRPTAPEQPPIPALRRSPRPAARGRRRWSHRPELRPSPRRRQSPPAHAAGDPRLRSEPLDGRQIGRLYGRDHQPRPAAAYQRGREPAGRRRAGRYPGDRGGQCGKAMTWSGPCPPFRPASRSGSRCSATASRRRPRPVPFYRDAGQWPVGRWSGLPGNYRGSSAHWPSRRLHRPRSPGG